MTLLHGASRTLLSLDLGFRREHNVNGASWGCAGSQPCLFVTSLSFSWLILSNDCQFYWQLVLLLVFLWLSLISIMLISDNLYLLPSTSNPCGMKVFLPNVWCIIKAFCINYYYFVVVELYTLPQEETYQVLWGQYKQWTHLSLFSLIRNPKSEKL